MEAGFIAGLCSNYVGVVAEDALSLPLSSTPRTLLATGLWLLFIIVDIGLPKHPRDGVALQHSSSLPCPHHRAGPVLRLAWGSFGFFFWLFYIWDVLWVYNAPCHIQPMHVLSPVYINSWNNSRVISVCFVFWGTKGMEIVPKTSWQHHCLVRSQSKIGTVIGVYGTDLVWGYESLPVAKRTHSWTCSLCLSRTALTKSILLQLIKTES